MRRSATRPNGVANRIANLVPTYPNAAPGRADRRAAIQTRHAGLRCVRASRHLVRELMTTQIRRLYPEVIGAPKDRLGHAAGSDLSTYTGLPAGTEVFSADNHISVAGDIFFECFPEDLKDQAPRIWYEDGAYLLGRPGQSMVVGDFSAVLMQYDDMAGATTRNIQARVSDLAEDGVDRELVFPNAVLALFHHPDKGLRERIFT